MKSEREAIGVLIMITERGFYPVPAVPGHPLRNQAADHGKLNAHVLRVEDIDGNVLWEKPKH
jgi:hypothetical protein